MVYITSDLFGPNTPHERQYDDSPNYWHAMAHQQHAASLGKRKRMGADDGPHQNITRQHRPSPSRDSNRLHLHSTPPFDSNSNLPCSLFPPKQHEYTSERRPVKQLKRLSPKAPLVKSTSHLMDVDFDLPPTCQSQSHAVSDLRSCHACNKAPKRQKDLENYLDCRSKAICKKCIVEVGEEGDAWCLDCYSRNINS
ncbi:hypothetical protein AG0111_0g5233 [Alternaria gaisen]|uniref:Uncharacterized protein n=1 Tax=Alternaria gaisen TaxID=167740 RepID=A0ACB6FQH7_9PLEO|nr:hypothetical protein AG0111_0g5233 [Alternaria gaisen]